MSKNKVLTLAFIRRAEEILLGFKKRGFGQGRWNGFGGKVESGEAIEEAAKRELKEECGVEADRMERSGLLMFEFKDDPVLLEVHVFQTSSFRGQIIETEEMRPQWYNSKALPFSQMWPDDYLWFPMLLSGQKFYGYFTFEGMDTILDYKLDVVQRLEAVIIPQAPLSHSRPH